MALNELGPFYDADGNDITDQVLQEAQPQSGNAPGWRKKLEEDAEQGKEAVKQAAQATARAEAAERREALREAGVDLTSELGKFFADSYKGDSTAEAIKEAAGKIGLIPVSQTPAVQAEMQGLERIAAAGAGAGATPVASEEDLETQIQNFQGSDAEFNAFLVSKGVGSDSSRQGAKWLKGNDQTAITVPSTR